jgi:hypothetical protein
MRKKLDEVLQESALLGFKNNWVNFFLKQKNWKNSRIL